MPLAGGPRCPTVSNGWPSNGPRACWSSVCSTRASSCWPYTPTNSRPPVLASAWPAANPTPSTPSVWPNWPAPTTTASGRALVPDSDETKALEALTRAREDLARTRVALANRLRAELEAFWPGAAAILADADSPIALAFLERYPSPQDARPLGEKRLSGFLARHGCCGRRPASDLLARLREAPVGTAGELEVEARRAVVLALVAALGPLVEQIELLSSQIAGAVRAHPDGEVFLSLFRGPKSTVTAARLVAEIGDCRGRYPSAETMAADAGMSPVVAVEPGKRKVASFRRACDKRLRDAVSTLADATRHHNPWAKDVYGRAISRGHDHPHAIRVLGRAWVRVIWRMWQDGVPYDPAKHGGLRRLDTAGG